ncbi:MAG: tail fiber protein [Bacteroidales bacterium]|jgi:microcystin-dependent protein|nr:tail fiber protein [Bacteroidales bacterium]
MDGLIGEIRVFSGNYAPENWLICDGTQLPISTQDYQALFSLIGTSYGGDGVTYFALPDFRGNVAIGVGQGINLTNRRMGERGGNSEVSLTIQSMPEHSHFARTSSALSNNEEHPSSSTMLGSVESSESGSYGYIKNTASGITNKNLNEATVQECGSGYPHNNVMPCTAINYIICYKGIYPQRT